eukprot:5104454-Pyramimonas_sp.AAC.1
MPGAGGPPRQSPTATSTSPLCRTSFLASAFHRHLLGHGAVEGNYRGGAYSSPYGMWHPPGYAWPYPGGHNNVMMYPPVQAGTPATAPPRLGW